MEKSIILIIQSYSDCINIKNNQNGYVIFYTSPLYTLYNISYIFISNNIFLRLFVLNFHIHSLT